MDNANRLSVEGPATTVCTLTNLLLLVPKVGPKGVFKKILAELAEDSYQHGGIDIRETFIDGRLTPAKKGFFCRQYQSRQGH